MTVLLVIDMQKESRSAPYIVEQVKELIQCSVRLGVMIIYIELHKKGEIYPELFEPVMDYPNAYIIQKYESDGSEEIMSLFHLIKFFPKHIIMCGVNRCACIRYTVLGLREKGYKHSIQIDKRASGCVCMHYKCFESYFGTPKPMVI